MSAIALAAGICTSCQKETKPSPDPGTSGGQVTVIATISDGGTKVSYSESGSNLNQSWTAGDHIVGWDASGKKIELEIKDESMIKDGKAIFTPVTGSAAVPSSGKVYMIYAPGKSYTDVSEKSLTYVLGSQNENSVPALMTATGSVSNNVLALGFINRLAIVAVKNPKFQVTEETNITGLQLSGGNILTTATFSEDDGELKIDFSEPGTITKACNFTTAADGTSETMVYFAVLPNNTPADITVSTSNPTGYQILFENKLFEAGKCYMLNQKDINKQTFTVTVANDITNGTITTDPSSGSSVAWGTEVTVTPAPATGYELATLTYNDGSDHDIKAVGTFTMPQSNVTVSGTFTPISYTLTGTSSPSEGGSVTFKKSGSEDGITQAYKNDVITIVSTPNTDYVFSSVSAVDASDGSVTIADNKFTMPASNVTVTTTFAKKSFSITSTPVTVTGGSFKVKKGDTEVTSAQWDETIMVEVTKPQYYAVDKIKVYKTGDTSVPVSVNADGTFTMPTYAVTIEVSFTPDGSAPPTEMPETIGL